MKKRIRGISVALILCLMLGMSTPVALADTVYTDAATATNTSMETATPIQPGDTIRLSGSFPEDGSREFYYQINTTAPGQFIQVTTTSSAYITFLAENRETLKYDWQTDSAGVRNCTAVTEETGAYFIGISNDTAIDWTGEVTLLDNDSNEPNNTPGSATPLTETPVEFITGWNDYDYFSVEATQPGQDVAVTISGFSYAVQGSAWLLFDREPGIPIERLTIKSQSQK